MEVEALVREMKVCNICIRHTLQKLDTYAQKMLQNLPYFWNKKTQIVIFGFLFRAILDLLQSMSTQTVTIKCKVAQKNYFADLVVAFVSFVNFRQDNDRPPAIVVQRPPGAGPDDENIVE